MRPRHKAAENALQIPGRRRATGVASMRPRHKAAENPSPRLRRNLLMERFNEAAA